MSGSLDLLSDIKPCLHCSVCSCVRGLSANTNRLDIEGNEHLGISSIGGDGGA